MFGLDRGAALMAHAALVVGVDSGPAHVARAVNAPVLVLFGPGISVNVPTPGRFAIHKLIISGERQTDAVGMAKSRKDILQASEIILALSQASNAAAIRQALDEAWERGPRWRDGITTGAKALAPEARKTLAAVSEGKINDDGEAPLTPRPQKRIRDGHTR